MTRRVKTRLGICSVWSEPSLSAWRNLKSLGTHHEISRSFTAKSRGVSPRNVAKFLRELSRSFSAKFRGEIPRRNKWFLFFSAKKKYFAQGVFRGETRKKELFFLVLICKCKFVYIFWYTCMTYMCNRMFFINVFRHFLYRSSPLPWSRLIPLTGLVTLVLMWLRF